MFNKEDEKKYNELNRELIKLNRESINVDNCCERAQIEIDMNIMAAKEHTTYDAYWLKAVEDRIINQIDMSKLINLSYKQKLNIVQKILQDRELRNYINKKLDNYIYLD